MLRHRRRYPAPNAVSVLIADDTRDSREMYAEYLTFRGYTVAIAADGRDALRSAFERPPHVVVLDLSMPRTDGWSIARLLKADERTRRTKIIAVSGLAFVGAEERAKAAGCDAYLSKPCLPKQLAREIERQLTVRSPAEAI
jgi:two-component system cell cycle response regulator DivK